MTTQGIDFQRTIPSGVSAGHRTLARALPKTSTTKLLSTLLVTCSALAVLCAFIPLFAHAQNGARDVGNTGLAPVFSNNSVRDIFSSSIQGEDANDIVLLRPKDEEEQMQEEAPQQPEPMMQQPQGNTAPERQLSQREMLRQKFGNPEEKFEVTAIGDAPLPFKGAIAAINAGDDKMAAKYLQQYNRYRKDLSNVNRKIMAISGQMQRREGMLAEGSWADAPEYSEFRYLRDIDLDATDEEIAEQLRVGESGAVTEANEETLRVLEGAFGEKFSLLKDKGGITKNDTIAREADERKERMLARRQLTGRIPYEPNGQFMVLYFLDTRDKVARSVADDVPELKKRAARRGATFKVVSLDDPRYQHRFRKATGQKFKINDGRELARRLGVKESPTVAFLSKSSGKVFLESGKKSFYYLDEALGMMQGK